MGKESKPKKVAPVKKQIGTGKKPEPKKKNPKGSIGKGIKEGEYRPG
ncbi:MAG: hypothetical protein Hyperionvirus12_35 [Hyperionvirus sp.]|uniref:Uncharacterized protein n=1 Tax=Hyperionvirus sp. TaxID=2487770 RepID=A0A3G5A9A6_9VIRU|nr:MAG: hypothetical protein Hyperionvirus12_35 [Hyperionvirus sp.]